MVKVMTGFIGAALVGGSLALAGPAAAAPAPAVSLVAASADAKDAKATPGKLGSTQPESVVGAQDAGHDGLDGARIETVATQGQVKPVATDGTIDTKATQGQVKSVAMDGVETMSTVATPQMKQST